MLRVGLTGGLASGKSFVGEELARLGCHVIQADAAGARGARSGRSRLHAVRSASSGRRLWMRTATIDRPRLAAEVFVKPETAGSAERPDPPGGDPARGRVDAGDRSAREWSDRGGGGGHSDRDRQPHRFDKLIVAVCTPEQQIERAMHRGLTREEALARLDRQMPLYEKRRYADFLIDTSGAKEETLRQVREVHEQLRSMRK